MSFLIDTNILLRRTQPAHPHHRQAVESVAMLIEAGERACITPQVVAEFWCVATRPVASNGLGFGPKETSAEVAKFESVLELLPDLPAIYREWRALIVSHEVRGVHVHDARLVAAMRVHGVARILTFNTSDFKRYDVEALHHSAVWSGRPGV